MKRHKEMQAILYSWMFRFMIIKMSSYKLLNKCNVIVIKIPTKLFMTLYNKMQRCMC